MSSSKNKRKIYDQLTTLKQKRKSRKINVTTRESSTQRNRAEDAQQLPKDGDDSSTTTPSSRSTDKNSYRNKEVSQVSRNVPPDMVEKVLHPSNVSLYPNEVNVNKTKVGYDHLQSAYDVFLSKKRENGTIVTGLKKYLREKWYEFTKFITKDKQTKHYMEDAMRCGYVSARTSEGVTEKEFANKNQLKVYTAMAELRRNSQNLARRHYLGKKILLLKVFS